MAEITIKDNAVGWLINFTIMMTYWPNIYPIKSRDRTRMGVRIPADQSLFDLTNTLNNALAIKGYSPQGQTFLTRPTSIDQFFADWYFLRSQLPGLLDASKNVPNPNAVLQLVDNFYNRWLASKVPKK